MDPFNNVNPFDRDFAIYNAAAPQSQQQQAEFEPYLNEVPQPDTAVNGNPACQDAYQPHVSEENRRLVELLGLEHQRSDGPHPEYALVGRENAAAPHSAPSEALNWLNELAAGRVDRNLLEGLTSLNSPVPHHQEPDSAVRHFNGSDGYQPVANERSEIAAPCWSRCSHGPEFQLAIEACEETEDVQPDGRRCDRAPAQSPG
ncbi:hypothetical protein SAMN05216525_111141 [Bradyrhizobium sp. Gha]|nr:hypothetical protein SAMN05216525_111141 [Bradyrhizobium sp. Gha]